MIIVVFVTAMKWRFHYKNYLAICLALLISAQNSSLLLLLIIIIIIIYVRDTYKGIIILYYDKNRRINISSLLKNEYSFSRWRGGKEHSWIPPCVLPKLDLFSKSRWDHNYFTEKLLLNWPCPHKLIIQQIIEHQIYEICRESVDRLSAGFPIPHSLFFSILFMRLTQ